MGNRAGGGVRMSGLFADLPEPASKISQANRPKTSAAGAKARDEDQDFFPTPVDVTEAFLRAEEKYFRRCGMIWEPACGDGAIARVIREKLPRYAVVATDLVDRGFGAAPIDFLQTTILEAKAIITNPPYKDDLPERFVRHAFALGAEYVALLLKVNFWSAGKRVRLWHELRPARRYDLTWRPDFLGLGGGMMDCAWFVWDLAAPEGPTVADLLVRPDSLGLEGGAA